jgi:hypothetical protein
MRKHKFQIFVTACLVGLLTVWLYDLFSRDTDEARFRQLKQTYRMNAWMSSAEGWLPGSLIRLIHLSRRQADYRQRFFDQHRALIDSGYLIEVPIPVTNRTHVQTISLVQKTFESSDAWFLVKGVVSKNMTITCRPEHEPLCRKIINSD